MRIDVLKCKILASLRLTVVKITAGSKMTHEGKKSDATYLDDWLMSLLLPNMMRICVSRAKWSLFSIFCDEKMVLGASNVSSKFWPLSLPGEIGGVAYNGDMHPISDRSAEKWKCILNSVMFYYSEQKCD